MVKGDNSRETWEQQYRHGVWDYLESEHQIPRYSVLCSYMKHISKNIGRPISLLDVGCGEGLILRFCDREWLVNYTGLDISQTALDKNKTILPTDKLICSALEEFSTDQKFDVILFNEVLYYATDPERQLNRFRNYINPGGFILISSWKKSGWFSRNSRSVQAVWRLIGKFKWKKIDEVSIKNTQRKSIWKIALMQP